MSRISTDDIHVLRTDNIDFLQLEDGTLYAILYKQIMINDPPICEDCESKTEKAGWLIGGQGKSFIIDVCLKCRSINLTVFNFSELPDPPEEWTELKNVDWQQISRKDMH